MTNKNWELTILFNFSNSLTFDLSEFRFIFLILEEESGTIIAGSNLNVFSIVTQFLGFCISFYLIHLLRKNKTKLIDLEDMVNPIYKIQIILTFRYFFAMMDYVITFTNNDTKSLNDFYEYTMWPLFLIQFWKLISNKDLIQLSRQRIYRFDVLYKYMIISLMLSVPFIIISNFVISNLILELITFIPLILFAYIIYRIIKTESEVVISKINKIRLEHLKNTWKYVIVHFLAWAVGNPILVEFEDNDFIFTWIYITQAIIMNLSPIFVGLSVYWALFIPTRSRERHNLINPKEFL